MFFHCMDFFFFFNDTATTEIYTLSLHDALPIFPGITGGITSGATYLAILVGSKVPPGIAAQARGIALQGTSSAAPPTAPALRNCRRVIIPPLPSPGPMCRSNRRQDRARSNR